MKGKRIYLTIDIECHDIEKRNQYIDGVYKNGNCGLKHILDLAQELEIPVNCFLDIPEANSYGEQHIKEIIDLIHRYGQHIYLHLHPDYISGDHSRTYLWQYDRDEKKQILSMGFKQYQKLLGHPVQFFRIGRYGADKEMYEVLNALGYCVYDLSFCSMSPKMCHISSEELKVCNVPTKYENQFILPNTRYLGLKLGKRPVFINFDASDTTFNEFKRILNKSSLKQFVFTMHSWNFIKKYYFLKKYIALDKYEERKFRKMVNYARKKGMEFCDLSTIPPIIDTIKQDSVINLCEEISDYPQMIVNNFIRFFRIGRLNKKYFQFYTAFFVSLALFFSIVLLLLLRG